MVKHVWSTIAADEVHSFPKVWDNVILELFVHKTRIWLNCLGDCNGKHIDRAICSAKRSLQDLLSKQAGRGSILNVFILSFLHDFE